MSPARTTTSNQRNPRLDGLRGVAIALVLVWHYFFNEVKLGGDSLVARGIQAVLGMTWSGVDLFFVLSGFLIGGILVDHKGSPSFFKTFYIRRLCRIVPVYYALLLAFVLARSWLGEMATAKWLFADAHTLWSYATFTQTLGMFETGQLGGNWLGATWSLAIEEHFYLVMPLMVFWLPRRCLFPVAAALTCLAVALRIAIVFCAPEHKYINFFLMPCRADALLFGVMGALAFRHQAIREALTRNVKSLYGAWLALLAGVIALGLTRQHFVSDLMFVFGYAWLGLFYLVTLLTCVHERCGFISTVCSSRLLQKLGVISYGVYLFHQPVSGLLHGCFLGTRPAMNDGASALVTLLALVLTLTLAKLSFTFFEKPIINFGHRFRYQPAPASAGESNQMKER
jgi:peptidoglycan/LPS O-acetylase OafA/YrhL